MPWRISGAWRTSTVSKPTPRWSRIEIARAEKPHWGKRALPFMNRTTSLDWTISSILELASDIWGLLIWNCGGELERVERPAHPAAERFVDPALLGDARHPPETLGDHPRAIMVAVAGEVGDLDAGIGNALAD